MALSGCLGTFKNNDFHLVFQICCFPPFFASLSPILTHMMPSWPHLGPSWRHLGASWGPPGASLGRPGSILWPPWAVLGASLEPSSSQDRLDTVKDPLKIASWSPSSSKDHPRCRHDDFSCLLDPNLGPIWPSPAASDPSKTMFFLRFFNVFAFRAPPKSQKHGAAVDRRRRLQSAAPCL